MDSERLNRRVSRVLLVCLVIFIVGIRPLAVHAQERANPVSEVKVSDAIKCWWRTDRGSVRIGEVFSVILTCQVVETENEKVILNENELDSSALSLTPYQVVGSVRYQDVRRGGLRFLQYEYQLKVIGDDVFGKDVSIPPLDIHYRIDRRATGLENISTAEKVYRLVELPMKIGSLVPKDAKDIRDNGNQTFGDVKDRRFRANLAFALSAVLLIVPLAIIALPMLRAARRLKEKRSNGTLFSNRKLLGRMVKELKRIRKERMANGWSGELVGKVLTICRIAGSISLSRNISQLSTIFETRGLEGQLKLRKGLVNPKKVMICSNLTPEMMQNSFEKDCWDTGWGKEFLNIFGIFNNSRYSAASLNEKELDDSLGRAIDLARQLHRRHFWLMRGMSMKYHGSKKMETV